MADFSALKQSIQNYIKQNGNKEITGAILQNILLSMVTTMGDGAINDNASDISDIKGDIQNINGDITNINSSITDINGDITDINGDITELNGNLSNEVNRAKGAETTTILFSDGKLVFKNAAGTVLYQLSVDSFLSAITTRLNTGALYAGFATPSTTPAALTGQEVFYLATQAGTYTNFHFNGGDEPIVLTKDGIYFIVSGTDDDDWNAEPMLQLDDVPTASSNNAVKSGGVAEELALGAIYDVSAKNPTAGHNNDGKWESLSALLSDANLNTLIPTSVRKGGMSVKFVSSVDNKYVQWRLMNNDWSTTVSDWQGIDDVPTAGSNNLVKSGGIEAVTSRKLDGKYIEDNSDFSFSDERGNKLAEFANGHFRTKKFDSKKVNEELSKPRPWLTDNNENGFLFSDEEGNIIGGWKDGHETSKYPSSYTKDNKSTDLDISDEKGNIILSVINGYLKTKNFSSYELKQKVLELIEKGDIHKISILFVGNSMTQDAISYLPYVLKQIAPNIEFKFYIYFTGGFTLADQYNNFIHESIPGTFSICENNIRWTNNTSWESTIHKSMKEWLKVIDFNILCLQDYFSTKPNDNNAVTDFNNCVNYIRDNYDGQFKVVTLFHRPRTNVFDPNGPQSTLDCFNMTKDAVEKCMKQTACQSVIACGVAAYFATLDPILQPLGDIGNLTPDGSHAQDTMACVMQSFTAALWIFSELGLPYGIYNKNIRINQDLFNAINPPGPNIGTGIIVGTDEQNNEAQLIAIKAYKYGLNLVNNSLV